MELQGIQVDFFCFPCLVFSTIGGIIKSRSRKMQQPRKTMYEKCLIGVTGTAWIAGLLFAGSDSPYMPVLNSIGLIVFFCASIFLGKLLHPEHSKHSMVMYPGFSSRQDSHVMPSEKENRRIDTRCAMGV